MTTVIRFLCAAGLFVAPGLVLSCGSSNDEVPDPFAGVFRDGTYTRFDDGKNYEVLFGVSPGRYVLFVDGAEQRRGTHTTATTTDGDPALGLVDEGDFPARCPQDQQLSAYIWKFKDNKLSLDAFEEKCDQRKKELESGDWLYQGPPPTSTAAPRSHSGSLGDERRADTQRVQDLVAPLGILFGERPHETEAARNHHVAVRRSKIRLQTAVAVASRAAAQ